MQLKLKEQTQKAQELAGQLRDQQYYTQAMEKENNFLRLEIERTKYSKDKEGYSRFISGLMKNKSSENKSKSIENVQKSNTKET